MHTFDHVVLHKRHVFVSGSMVNRFDLIRLENLKHPVLVMNRTDEGDDLHVERLTARQLVKRLIDRVECSLRDVKHDESFRSQARYLYAQLRTNGTACARDHD